VQILKKGAPCRIVTKDRVSKSDDVAVHVGADGVQIHAGRCQAIRPDFSSLRNNVAVEVRVEVGASIVTTPTVSVQERNGTGITPCRLPVLHNRSRFEPATA